MTGDVEDRDPWSRWPADAGLPHTPLADQVRAERMLPVTLRPIEDARVRQYGRFEPALKHYGNAFRAGEPVFADEGLAHAWTQARRAALDLVLAAIASSAWADSLVLRGSVLLRAWCGEAAREPGDLDFVVVPQSWDIGHPATSAMLTGIAHAAQQTADRAGGPVRFDASGAVSDEIWTYDRVPGRRLVLPWTAGELPGGVVQLDFVFDEELPEPPAATHLAALAASSGTAGARLLAVSPGLSLAWKLKWLVTDAYPQGKDLYDAMLLAEYGPIPYELVGAAFTTADLTEVWTPPRPGDLDQLAEQVDWEPFVADHPALPTDLDEVIGRLRRALAPMFRGLPARGEPEHPLYVACLVRRLRAERAAFAADPDLPALLGRLADQGLSVAVAVVFIRELLGPDRCDVPTARELLLAHPAWAERWDRGATRSYAQARLDRL
ncbi:nucleotidyl transferase AbiEii/AbiGii toxin family protein [Streptacidiphilus pinicola]|uniref:Nucleotidyl transferase AbiEii/AbiGii toxin family protein n=1 Tax=Streptacidiphilus pinicola TaxID=2219663 RepID=A0A2X0ID94_9ACTN|nr:nucleotidyl transferase AbiEii/AbiGii toxin family protein [Streptacidiphilus pinicola]RAG82487.1 nucleotidyl transferase AbiEii/AbiGii toxin family protein [Streptacidiphilus pinicola]